MTPWPLPRRARAGAVFAALLGIALCAQSAVAAGPQPAACDTAFDIVGARCDTLTVPIDRSGKVPGTVKLFVERVAAEKRAKSALVFFPGGPGASTTLLAQDEVAAVRPALADHDLLLFDQRGTGRSDYLDCNVALTPSYYVPAGDAADQLAKTVQRCADRIGPRRSFYTTRDTVEDLEAIRKALGYDKLVLVAVSYGTRDATAYARAYPDHVERIVLDSLVPDAGIDPFGLSSIEAIPRVLHELCRGGGCDGITTDPLGDLAALVAKLGHTPMRAKRAISFAGCRLRPAIERSRLYALFAQADEDPKLLAQLPVAIAAALRGDPYQLSELEALSSPYLLGCGLRRLLKGLALRPRSFAQDQLLLTEVFSTGDQLATLCEETTLPWPRDSQPSQRRRAAEQVLAGYPDSAFAPFDRATVLSASLIPLCKFWPASREPPVVSSGPLPAVPTLVLTGLDDLRTPNEDAMALARENPAAQVLAVPDVGHSVLTSSQCARQAFARFMDDQPLNACHMYAHHHPAPVRRVRDVFSQLGKLLQTLSSASSIAP